LPIFADATYLFVYRSTLGGIQEAIAAQTLDLVSGGARTDGSLAVAQLAAVSPTDAMIQPVFNPVGGYASYILPAAFILILQQTLLIGSAFLTGAALTQSRGHPVDSVLGRGIAHLTLYVSPLALYVIVLPRLYGVSTLGHVPAIFAMAVPFVLAASFMGQTVGAWFKHPETATLVMLATGIPQLFMTGFSYPREALPDAISAFARIFPVDLAVDGIVRINQLGADLSEVAHDWWGLWLLTLVYFALAVLSAFLRKRRLPIV